jgi:hypothetical protein
VRPAGFWIKTALTGRTSKYLPLSMTASENPPPKNAETERDQVELLRELVAGSEATAFVEQVGGYTGKGQPGSAMFKFGRSFGFTLGVLQTLGVRVELVQPQKWQKPLGLGTASSCATRSEWKAKLRACAQ